MNAARPDRVHEARDPLRFSAREQTSMTSPMCQRVTDTVHKACEEQSREVITNFPDQHVNDVVELVFDMMLHSEFEVAGRSIELHTNPF